MPKRVSKEEVYDENGKRRFHGAFTGGFSAGYFNTVGSEEGWTPAAFVSTRNQHVDFKTYSKEDFMDTGDNPLVGRNLETHNIFSESKALTSGSGNMRQASRAEGKAHTLGDLIQSKKHYYGIGYVPIQGLHSSSNLLEDDSRNVMRMGDILHSSSVNTSAFGMGALEDRDDMDVYASNNMNQFDRELDSGHHRIKDIELPEDRHHRHHEKTGKPSEIEGFVTAAEDKKKRRSESMVVYPPPRVPSSYRERHTFDKPLDWSWVIQKSKITGQVKPKVQLDFGASSDTIDNKRRGTTSDPSSFRSKFVEAGKASASTPESIETSITVKSTHVIQDWRPAKLLCKRFNIRDPYKNLPDVEPTPAPKSDIIEDIFSGTEKKVIREDVTHVDVDLDALKKEFEDPLQNVKKADIDLFDELFKE